MIFYSTKTFDIMKYLSVLIFLCSLTSLIGCKDDKDVAPAQEGIIFSPIKPYQEALPGSIINFDVRVKAPEPVVKFGVRFLFPGASDYVALPQYPDVTDTFAYTNGYINFEYALPPSTAITNTDMKFKFIASTVNKTYETEYTVRMKNVGGQAARLYGPENYSYYKFGAIDLINIAGVPQDAPSLTKDIVSYNLDFPYEGKNYPVIIGFTSENGTKFRLGAAADYALAPSQFAARYNALGAAVEYSIVGVPPTIASPGTNVLVANQYYIAKINRNGVFSYAMIWIRKIPSATLRITGPKGPMQLPGSETLDIEIKK